MTDEDFVQLYPDTSNAEMARLTDRSIVTVLKRARRLQVRKSPQHQSAQQAAKTLGRTRPSETRQKIADKARGRIPSQETIRKIVASRSASGKASGPNHYKWKGGKAWKRFKDPAYIAWRNAVLERDHYRCQDCGRQCKKHEKGLAAHHLKSYADHPDLRLDVDNGITLCRGCHMARHGRAPAPKPQIDCACGCRGLLEPVDRYGRPRRFINHHHRRGPAGPS